MKSRQITVGIDEVGRGCLSGDCWASAVAFIGDAIPDGIRDSKALTEKRRRELYSQIRACALVGVGRASAAEIDRINILNAAMLAMKRAFEALPAGDYVVLVDGNRCPDLGRVQTTAVIGGDALHVEISAASIIAKVERDAHMDELHSDYPHFDWASNKGYGTPKHLEALRIHGPSPYHRMSFTPVSQGSLAL